LHKDYSKRIEFLLPSNQAIPVPASVVMEVSLISDCGFVYQEHKK